MLEAARRNFDTTAQVKVLDQDLGTIQFKSITAETLGQRGKLYPMGARHFAQQAQVLQNLNGFVASAAYADPLVQAHVSPLKIAELYEEMLGLSRFELVKNNIRVAEQQQTQSLAASAQEGVVDEIANRQAVDEEGEEEV